jgi:hypothetical protein
MYVTILRYMNYVFLFFSLMFLFNSFSQDKEVLFVGNSYTYYNSMPNTLTQIALNKGHTLNVTQHTPGGTRLMTHDANTTVTNLINSQYWDYVVLQAQSQEPSWGIGQVSSEVFPHARSLSEKVYSSNSCSVPMFFMTWGRENGDASNCANFNYLCSYEGMDSALQVNYTTMAEDNLAAVSPVAKVWRYIRDNYPSMDLYSDGSHPNATGSYLIAVTFFTMIYNESPLGISYYGSENQADAEIIINAVESVVYQNIDEFFFGNSFNDADHQLSCNTDCTNPTDAFEGLNDVVYTGGEKWLTHTATQTGDLRISTCGLTNLDTELEVYSDCSTLTYSNDDACSSTSSELTVPVTTGEEVLILISSPSNIMGDYELELEYSNTASLNIIDFINLNVYPNPVQDLLFIEGDLNGNAEFEIIDILGKLSIKGHMSKSISTEDLKPGVYFLMVAGNSFRFVKD